MFPIFPSFEKTRKLTRELINSSAEADLSAVHLNLKKII